MELSEMTGMIEAKPLFSFLKRIFIKEIDSDFLMEIQQLNINIEESDLDQGFNLMAQAAVANSERKDEYIEALAVEFARLFIGPNRAPAIPFASSYLSENRSVMCDVTLAVRKQYLAAGLAVQNLYQMPEDHIGYELEFMEYLLNRFSELQKAGEQEEINKHKEIMNDFFNDHLAKWAPSFADSILEHTTENFYRGTALILKEVCSQN